MHFVEATARLVVFGFAAAVFNVLNAGSHATFLESRAGSDRRWCRAQFAHDPAGRPALLPFRW